MGVCGEEEGKTSSKEVVSEGQWCGEGQSDVGVSFFLYTSSSTSGLKIEVEILPSSGQVHRVLSFVKPYALDSIYFHHVTTL